MIELFGAIQVEAAYEAAEAIVLSAVIQAEAAWMTAGALVAARLIEEAAPGEAARVVPGTIVPGIPHHAKPTVRGVGLCCTT